MKKIFLFIFAFLFFIWGSLKAESTVDCGILTTYKTTGNNYIRIYFIPYVYNGETFERSKSTFSYRASPYLPGIAPAVPVCIAHNDDYRTQLVSLAPVPSKLTIKNTVNGSDSDEGGLICNPDNKDYWQSKCVQTACKVVGNYSMCTAKGYIPNDNDQQQTPAQD